MSLVDGSGKVARARGHGLFDSCGLWGGSQGADRLSWPEIRVVWTVGYKRASRPMGDGYIVDKAEELVKGGGIYTRTTSTCLYLPTVFESDTCIYFRSGVYLNCI
jgi:hypothetical protein